jgi:hypothetical protein
MQKVIVNTTGALYSAGQLSVGLRLGFNGVQLLRKPAANPLRRTRSKWDWEGAAFGPPFLFGAAAAVVASRQITIGVRPLK